MGKRANFISIQQSHYVPIKDSDVSRLRSGFEGLVASRTSQPFAYTAEGEGKIEDIDEEAKVVKVRYKSGKAVCLSYGEEYTCNSANGFYVNQKIAINNFKIGDKVSKGDVITYNREYFQADPYSKQVNWKIGILAKVAIMDCGGTLEDASILTRGLCDRMTFEPVHVRRIVLTKDTHVHAFADLGQKLMSTDPLMIFDESAADFGDDASDEMAELLGNLNKASPKADYTGEIVKIQAMYKCSLSEMDPSIRKIVQKASVLKNARASFAKDCDNAEQYSPAAPMVATQKVGIDDLNEDTVILDFYIKQHKGMGPGDKLFFDNCLKSVCSTVHPEITTEDGTKIDAVTSARGVLARIITSPFIQGITNSTLHKLEENILKVWNE